MKEHKELLPGREVLFRDGARVRKGVIISANAEFKTAVVEIESRGRLVRQNISYSSIESVHGFVSDKQDEVISSYSDIVLPPKYKIIMCDKCGRPAVVEGDDKLCAQCSSMGAPGDWTISFGKYTGRNISDIVDDIQYLQYLVRVPDKVPSEVIRYIEDILNSETDPD